MKKKIGIVVMSLVLCLALVGVGYAKWSDTVDINGTVNTGTVEVGILNVETNDPGTHGIPGDPDSWFAGSLDPKFDPKATGCPCTVPVDKNVASVDSYNVDAKCLHDGTQYFQRVEFVVDNAYPFYCPCGEIHIANCGTIPVKVDTISYTTGGTDLTPWAKVVCWSIDINGKVVAKGAGADELMTAIGHYQIEPCSYLSVCVCVEFQELNAAGELMPQTASMTCECTVTCSQWNEV